MTTSDKYWWITQHPSFINEDHVSAAIEVEPHNVCPLTNRIEEYKPLNTKVRYWVEFIIPWYDEERKEWCTAHDWERDTGGDTYDEAIDNLYKLVLEKYGDYTDEDYDLKFNEIYKIQPLSNNNYFQTVIRTPHEVNHHWSSDILSKEDIVSLKEDIKQEKNYMNALIEFKKSCTMEQLPEVITKIQGCEHNIWIKEECIRMGIDIDL